MKSLKIVAVLAAVSGPMFCSLGGAQEMMPRIINGDPTDGFPSVGIVGSQRYGDFCSGTLISPYHVLTAGHCGSLIEGPKKGTFKVGGSTYTTSHVFVHPQYNDTTLANDIAILELSEPVLDVVPSTTFRGVPQIGDILTIVGYGAGGDPDTGSDGTFGTKRVGTTTIDEMTDTLIIWNFDSVSESNTAPGDSGGPGFIEVTEAGEVVLFIACITSGGTQSDAALGDMSFNTRVDAYSDWIDAVVDSFDDSGTPPEEPSAPPCQPGHHSRPPHVMKPPHYSGSNRPGHNRPGNNHSGHNHPGHSHGPAMANHQPPRPISTAAHREQAHSFQASSKPPARKNIAPATTKTVTKTAKALPGTIAAVGRR